MPSYNDNLRWRYATKKFDATKKLPPAQLEQLLESTQLAASSYGLQPYKVLVITDPALRAKIREHAWNQAQVTDASHLAIFCAYRSIDEAYVDAFVELIAKERGMPVESLKGYRDMMAGSIRNMNPGQMAAWTKMQSYIGLGFLLSAAAQMHVDACPMEGFDAAKVDEVLGLADLNLTATTFCPLGFRAADDAAAGYKKVRFPKEELFIFKGN